MNSNFYIVNNFLLDLKYFFGAYKEKRQEILNLIGMQNNLIFSVLPISASLMLTTKISYCG